MSHNTSPKELEVTIELRDTDELQSRDSDLEPISFPPAVSEGCCADHELATPRGVQPDLPNTLSQSQHQGLGPNLDETTQELPSPKEGTQNYGENCI